MSTFIKSELSYVDLSLYWINDAKNTAVEDFLLKTLFYDKP